MVRFILLILICFGFTSCKDKKADLVSSDTSTYELSTEKWPDKLEVDSKARDILKDWPEFTVFETSFDALYNVANRDDLSLTIEDLIEKQNALEASKYPEVFDKPQVKSRQKVFKTYILKVKGDIYYRIDPQESVVEMIKAYNAFRNQFNVVVNNTLDTDLILEE
ncbi:hypothetical protein SAMN05421636_101279 [Pricia antarctica]|uniref:Uncharacterized protein n=1 Tax=Pricia antarctica TaxID=641691 RepID=A0A1G6WDS4_9FLAO|nr:hypothetical protein [Pricia antarctica]SDD63981.1 hypothetical protein SAMN05421636_101279 [Pricia antarctica]